LSNQAKVTIVLEAVNKAKTVLEQTKNDVKALSSQIQEANRRMVQNAKLSLEQVKTLASGFSSLATSLWGFYAIYDKIGTQQRQLASLQAAYNRTLVSYQALQYRLNQALAKYGENSEEVRLIREKLAATEERLQVYQIQIAEYQGNINETLVQGALLAFPMAVNAAAGLSTAFNSLSTVSLTRVIPALKAVGLTLKGALGPIGLILAAVGILYTAWTQNWGGIRDATQKAVEAILRILENLRRMLKPILDPLTSAFQKIGEFLGLTFPASVEKAERSLEAVASSVEPAAGSLESLEGSLLKLGETLPNLEEWAGKIEGEFEAVQ